MYDMFIQVTPYMPPRPVGRCFYMRSTLQQWHKLLKKQDKIGICTGSIFLGVLRLNMTNCKNSNVLRSQQANYDMAERLGDRM
jgi:hypothetical protein